MSYSHDCDHTSLQHGTDGCNVPGCLCAFMSWNESDYEEAMRAAGHDVEAGRQFRQAWYELAGEEVPSADS